MKSIIQRLLSRTVGAVLFWVVCAVLFAPVSAHVAAASTSNTSSTPSTSSASKSAVCKALSAGSDCGTTPTNGVNINHVITGVINLLSLVVGIVAVVMLMVAGFMFITANGDSGKVTTARHTFTYALVGVVVAAFAQFIVQFVLNRVTK